MPDGAVSRTIVLIIYMTKHPNQSNDSPRQAGAEIAEVQVTPEMIEAGVSALQDLEGEASKAYLAEAVYRAMAGLAGREA